MTQPQPEVLEVEARAEAVQIKMSVVLREAGVPASTWWRWRKGGVEPKVTTLRKVRHSLDRLASEQAAA
ncbi:helix-turn-helix domain-containing protein [Brevundimonas balnearis]|uniref:Helix-turn-helix domain-containing protein n=1 Tax=Brevundimonas balnearis TaxID=1572858 RepID=A0ABV6R0W3_9CAUL